MAIDRKFVGRSYGPYKYQLGLEKMREFAYAVACGIPSMGFGHAPQGLHPLFFDEEAGRQGPYGSVIAFPTFAVTFAMAPFGEALADAELGIDLLRVVHGEQEFEFGDVMRPGDTMTTTGAISKISSKGGLDFVTVTTDSVNQHGTNVVRGTWTAVIRSP